MRHERLQPDAKAGGAGGVGERRRHLVDPLQCLGQAELALPRARALHVLDRRFVGARHGAGVVAPAGRRRRDEEDEPTDPLGPRGGERDRAEVVVQPQEQLACRRFEVGLAGG